MRAAVLQGSVSAASDDAAERALLARIASRDRAAMREFYLLYHRRLARFLARITPRLELVDEIVNDTMMIVWQQSIHFRGDSRVSTWVFGIAYRHGLKSLRSAASAAAPVDPGAETVQEYYRAFEHREWLDKALATLSLDHRVTLELTYYAGYSCEEIASIMDCPVNTVKTRTFYARERLRTLLPSLAEPTRSTP